MKRETFITTSFHLEKRSSPQNNLSRDKPELKEKKKLRLVQVLVKNAGRFCSNEMLDIAFASRTLKGALNSRSKDRSISGPVKVTFSVADISKQGTGNNYKRFNNKCFVQTCMPRSHNGRAPSALRNV